jgi:regulatory protein
MTLNMRDGSNDPYRKALNTALRILTRRDHSKHELSQKLKARGYVQEVINDVISECERFDYINDERTAEVFIRRLQRKGYGRKRIRSELNWKGLHSKNIQRILLKSISDTDECQDAVKIYQKHAKRFNREKDELKRKDKIYKFLYGRGFSRLVISEAISKIGTSI